MIRSVNRYTLTQIIFYVMLYSAVVVAAETNGSSAAISPEQVVQSTALYKAGLELQKTQNNLASAVGKYEAALQLNPTNADCLNHYAWFLAVDAPQELKNIDRGIALALRAVSASDGKRPDILDTLAEAYFQQGDIARAIETGRRAIRAQQESGSNKFKNYLERQQAKFEAKR